jgi:universal stress protein A
MSTYPFRRIAIATDFGAASGRALELASELAAQYKAELVVIHSIEAFTPAYPIGLVPDRETVDAMARKELDREVERAKTKGIGAEGVLLHGEPPDRVIDFVESNPVDLLVVGTHGRKGVSRWMLGSAAEKIVRACRTPVLTVHDEAA